MQYRVYYMRPEFTRDGFMGHDWLAKHGQLPDPAALDKTHTLLTVIEAASLDCVFYDMQAEQWSPNGEARDLIRAKGLTHTSMSVGDVIAYTDAEGEHVMIVDNMGFRELKGAAS